MSPCTWRDSILNEFVPNISKVIIVIDPDDLLTEEKLSLELKNRGFDLIDFKDSVEFRYAYESGYRTLWDQGQQTKQTVVIRVCNSQWDALPYDLLKAGRILKFTLGNIFPNLSYSIIEKLDSSFLDELFAAQNKYSPRKLGNNDTKDFVIQYVFGIVPYLITNDVELLRTLLRIHYNKLKLPPILSGRLVQILKGNSRFNDWPLEIIVSDDGAFFAFLQERWPPFLDVLAHGNHIIKETSAYNLKYGGPTTLPFDHEDIRVYIDNLFVEGKLIPVQKSGTNIETNPWIKSGVSETNDNDPNIRINGLLEIIENEIPVPESLYSEWIDFAMKWAELRALIHTTNQVNELERFKQISTLVNNKFTNWMLERYAGLINLPPTNPAMLHHVPRRMVRELESEKNMSLALVVVDGLSLDQWVTIKKVLHEQDPNLVMKESATFAWIPTLTSVSRQAVFSGRTPISYPKSINTTNNEGNLWRQFWEDNGVSRQKIAYQRSLGDGNVCEILDDSFNLNQTKVIGLVVDKVDKIMHGMQLGASGMHNQIKQWCEGGFLFSLIEYLLDNNYQVWLTSDHGNIECNGKGRSFEGSIAENRGERARIYPTLELRDSVAKTLPFAIKWNPIGLPPGYFPLVTEGDDAFVKEGETIVGHGGISMEEVIVPLVKFEKRSR
ncbi:PglZ domain protein [Methanosalsum zhilinae DSM 4017]|uniref:PglZ domain protein n=1 Tax=Methanosalsum zhilinae (strain DSM 4017 / NBRC 107636 / OCM 62 / WeN5) TaxID=679901 RepID=F7XN37_METZD|nr:BREX-3 system phosphatase PglZ [Methanosalsum zhilinae]AEH61151.1 PglZ domain protein [Methanosalsum zhilinae DSM 4017]